MERPILFSGPMVRAILDGRKTQTRRVLGKTGHYNIFEPGAWSDSYVIDPGNADWRAAHTPYRVGDNLWVREQFSGPRRLSSTPPRMWEEESLFNRVPVWYWADGEPTEGDWTRPKPSIHMPRWASRLTLTVTGVKVERLQDISSADTLAEGVQCPTCIAMGRSACGGLGCFASRDLFRGLWISINGEDSWASNPWVAAITFEPESPTP